MRYARGPTGSLDRRAVGPQCEDLKDLRELKDEEERSLMMSGAKFFTISAGLGMRDAISLETALRFVFSCWPF